MKIKVSRSLHPLYSLSDVWCLYEHNIEFGYTYGEEVKYTSENQIQHVVYFDTLLDESFGWAIIITVKFKHEN